MPQNRTRSPGAITSGMRRPAAAASSSFVGRRTRSFAADPGTVLSGDSRRGTRSVVDAGRAAGWSGEVVHDTLEVPGQGMKVGGRPRRQDRGNDLVGSISVRLGSPATLGGQRDDA